MNCSNGQIVQANPDISGPGGMIAFAFTSTFASFAIAIAYLFDSLPDAGPGCVVNDLDCAVVGTIQRTLHYSTSPLERVRKARSSLIQGLMLVLGDQQLIAGLAIFIAGLANNSTLSAYHFLTIVCLGWFSATTHLSTLSVLHNYFRENATVRYLRIAGMLVMACLLIFGLLVLYSQRGDTTMPVKCLFSRLSIRHFALVKKTALLSQIAFIGVSYINKMARLWMAKRESFGLRHSISKAVWPRRNPVRSRQTQYVDLIGELTKTRSKRAAVKAGLLVCCFVYIEFLDSFLWQVIWLGFLNLYGLRQLWWARFWLHGTVLQYIRGNETQITYGQLVPLLLLILPILTVIEGLEGVRKAKRHATDLPRSQSQAEPTTEVRHPEDSIALSNLQSWHFTGDESATRRLSSEIDPTDSPRESYESPQPLPRARTWTCAAPKPQTRTQTHESSSHEEDDIDPLQRAPTVTTIDFGTVQEINLSRPVTITNIEDKDEVSTAGGMLSELRRHHWHNFWDTLQQTADSAAAAAKRHDNGDCEDHPHPDAESTHPSVEPRHSQKQCERYRFNFHALARVFFIVMLIYVILALTALAWFMAGQYTIQEYEGLRGSLVIVSVPLLGVIPPYWIECKRLAGR